MKSYVDKIIYFVNNKALINWENIRKIENILKCERKLQL